MFKLDRSFFEYLADLSDPEVTSSTDLEDIELKRQIIRYNFYAFILTVFVLFVIINLFIFYLPGLFNVFFAILYSFLVSALIYWPILLVGGVVFLVLLFLAYRSS